MSAHGTSSQYNHGRCRCDACTKAHRERCYRVRDNLHLRPFEDIPHGTVGGYSNWGCRCVDCTRVHSARCRAYHQKRQAAQ